jgi:hypothetical protein
MRINVLIIICLRIDKEREFILINYYYYYYWTLRNYAKDGLNALGEIRNGSIGGQGMAMASPPPPPKKKKKLKKIYIKYIYICHGPALKTFKYLGPSPTNFLNPFLGEMSKYENLRWIT